MKYGLIGEHLPHSFSKEIHNRIAPYEYELCELAWNDLGDFFEKKDFSAINVTIPYKQAVIPYLQYIDPQAKEIGAVNTIVNRDGKLYGYNTDFFGMKSLIQHLSLSLEGAKVLVLGTGGTSHTACAVAKHLGAYSVILVGRTEKNNIISYERAYAEHTDADFIINTTPCGMYPYPDGREEMAGCPISLSEFSSLKGVIDAIYNPLRTNLVFQSLEKEIVAEGGLYMLVAQAVKAAEYFMDTKLDFDCIDRIYSEIRAEKENIVLTGMPGSGKTTVGNALANVLQRPFWDTDVEIVKKVGKRIPEIFEECGEAGFRKIESDVIRELTCKVSGAIIATGGGAILKDENVLALRRNGRVYFLNRALSEILPTQDRPLSSNQESLKRRFEERYERYLSTCDCEIKTDEQIEHTIIAIRKDFFQ